MGAGRRTGECRGRLQTAAFALLLPAAIVAAGLPAQTAPPRTDEQALDQALNLARRDARAPGASAAVFRRGELVWSGASGVRNLESLAPVRTDTRFIPASTGKAVTATMVMALADAGRLSLDDRVSRHLPRLRGARGITVRQLLNHTSGLPDYLDDERISRLIEDDPGRDWTRREVLAAVRRLPRGRPGRAAYSNTNYIALGGIIEAASGRSVEAVFRDGVGSRAGMSRSTWPFRRRGARAFARPYVEEADGDRDDRFTRGVGLGADYWGEVWTDGGLATTATDLAGFFDALFGGRLVSETALARMTAFGPDETGLGLFDRRFVGGRWFGHDGSYDGYTCEGWHDPATGVTIVALVNFERYDDDRATPADVVWRAIARAYDRLSRG